MISWGNGMGLQSGECNLVVEAITPTVSGYELVICHGERRHRFSVRAVAYPNGYPELSKTQSRFLASC